jgi:shikimate 5-dehydrogenase
MENAYSIETKSAPTFYFIGVTTKKSSIMKVFPLSMKELGRQDIVMEGIDLKIHDDPQRYRQAVAQIKFDPNSLGALVTTHKMDLFATASDMFEYLDPYARICSELSSISKLEGRLEGHAKDPITAGLSLDAIIGSGYFGRTNAEVLIFGAGGSSIATLLHLINKKDRSDRPSRFTVINHTQPRLDHMRTMVEKLGTDIEIKYLCSSDAHFNDEIMATLPDYSIVINATGMGKDVPGSPITDSGIFPKNGIAWEFNYRGELDFMHQAEKQAATRNVRIEDGWIYFLHGWTQVVAQVLHVDLTPEVFQRLANSAETVHQ